MPLNSHHLRYLILLSCILLSGIISVAQERFTVNGYIKDQNTGETLIGANIYNASNPTDGTTSNTYGFFALSLPEGSYQLIISYLGYEEQTIDIDLNDNFKIEIGLVKGLIMEEVVISAEEDQKAQNVEGTQMGTIDLPIDNVKLMPALFGEVDILKTLQLLPGVLSAGEGSAGFYVRGGGPDQNLVLLDEAVVYNSGHLLGFFSVFNSDAINNTTLIKGGIPARYGGRISSVVDVQMKEGNDQYYQVDGGIGLISSRLTVQGPIERKKASFLISARRTYIGDLAQPAINNTDFAGSNYFFYDLNGKINYQFSNSDRLFLSAYLGRDVLKFRQPDRDFFFDLPYGNNTATLRWNHIFGNKLFMNLSGIYNEYEFKFDGGQDQFLFKLFSGVRDYNAKIDFDYFPNPRHQVKFGMNYSYHKLTPNTASGGVNEGDFESELEPKYAHESAIYVQDEIKVTDKLRVNAGLRVSFFTHVGPYTSKLTGEEFGNLEPVESYRGFEPRINAKYSFGSGLSAKASVSFTKQYMHLVSNSTSTLPTDIWVPSTEIVKPQSGVQYALGIFKNFSNDAIETSLEVYYKDLDDQIDFSESYVDDLVSDVEENFVFGIGRSYGAELFVRKSRGKLNGWIGYTLSKAERSFPQIEDGRWYPTAYDRRNDLSVVLNYKMSEKWQLGMNYVYGTGKHYTPAIDYFFIGGELIFQYGSRNSAKLEDYHRMDLSLNFTPKPNSTKRFVSSWTFSVYNAYNRKNPFFLLFEPNTDLNSGVVQLDASKITLFPIIPSITWNFKWKQK